VEKWLTGARGVGAWLRIRNWPEYEAGLRRRSDLTIWLSEDAIKSWQEPPSGKPGGQRTYADIATESAATIRMVFHLPLRVHGGYLRKPPKNRGWRKPHFAVDADTGQIVALDLTGRRTPDGAWVPTLLDEMPNWLHGHRPQWRRGTITFCPSASLVDGG